MDKKTLLNLWGFDKDPFGRWDSNTEPESYTYYVKLPYYDDVVDDPDQPAKTIIFGDRGEGKSALARFATHKLIAEHGDKALVVEYNRFPGVEAAHVNEITLEDHLERIIGLTVVPFLNYLSKRPERARELDSSDLLFLALDRAAIPSCTQVP